MHIAFYYCIVDAYCKVQASCQTKEYTIVVVCFFSKHAALMS